MTSITTQAISSSSPKLTVLMPCLNEANTVAICVGRAFSLLSALNIQGEVLVVDNGSTDNSQIIAATAGARVVHCTQRGYGATLNCGIANALGEIILMGDADDSYRFDEADRMVTLIQEGYDICMGTRLKGTILPGAMPTLNRFLGNPVLTGIGKILFGSHLSDFHCGMRAFLRDKVLHLNLKSDGMEWATEMIARAHLANLSMTEVPITLHPDGRGRSPHLRRWRDGMRHLVLMLRLAYAPT